MDINKIINIVRDLKEEIAGAAAPTNSMAGGKLLGTAIKLPLFAFFKPPL